MAEKTNPTCTEFDFPLRNGKFELCSERTVLAVTYGCVTHGGENPPSLNTVQDTENNAVFAETDGVLESTIW